MSDPPAATQRLHYAPMVYAPGHFKEITQPRVRSPRERVTVKLFGLLAVILAGLAIYSLTSHQDRNGDGCIYFTYSTMIGGANLHACGAQAKSTCSTPPSAGGIDGDFQAELYIACRKAGLRAG